MSLNSPLIQDNRHNVVATSDFPADTVEPTGEGADKLLYVLDGCFRHTKIVIRPTDSERLNSLILSMINEDKMVTIIPSTRLLDIEQVIEILGVSPTYIKELDENGTLKFFDYGLSYVIEAEKVFTFKDQLQKDLEQACDEVIGMDQDLYFV